MSYNFRTLRSSRRETGMASEISQVSFGHEHYMGSSIVWFGGELGFVVDARFGF